MMKSKFTFFLLIEMVISCQVKTNDYINREFKKNVRNSLDIDSLLANRKKIVSAKIKEGILVVEYVEKGSEHPLLGVIDIQKKKLLKVIGPIPMQYYELLFDHSNNRTIYTSIYHLNKVFTDSIPDSITIDTIPFKGFNAGEILLTGNYLFYLKGVYGTFVLNLMNKEITAFQKEGFFSEGLSNNISYPINKDLNLLCGNGVSGDSIKLVAINKDLDILWSYYINKNKFNLNAVESISMDNAFVVKYDHHMAALRKDSGKIIWKKLFEDEIVASYKYGNSIIVYTLPTRSFPSSKNTSWNVSLEMINCSDGERTWRAKNSLNSQPVISVCSNKLFMKDKDSIYIYNINDGELLSKSYVKDSNSQDYFETIPDFSNGVYYTLLNKRFIFW